MSFAVNVDPTNPGQFFACCGLLELADRLWPGAEGWFVNEQFKVTCGGTLADLVRELNTAEMILLDNDIYSGRVELRGPFGALRLDWWHDLGGRPDIRDLKVWAGTMESYGIARAMQHTMRDPEFQTAGLFSVGRIAYTPDGDKKEPYYFDARRGPNAHSRDVGFSPNDLSMTTTAFPAVELLSLIGLQRCAPAKTDELRIYDYFTWSEPLAPVLLPAAVSGLMPHVGASGYRFENWFRTGQRKHKAFRSAIPLSREVTNE
jgi:CRISPR-associated protein Csb3